SRYILPKLCQADACQSLRQFAIREKLTGSKHFFLLSFVHNLTFKHKLHLNMIFLHHYLTLDLGVDYYNFDREFSQWRNCSVLVA
ncbi:MAG: hypothetical protein LBF32_04640, partial [Streptococcaceae bacterium]|nr:hypothetical protein [Streptococcaceae bacterium]